MSSSSLFDLMLIDYIVCIKLSYQNMIHLALFLLNAFIKLLRISLMIYIYIEKRSNLEKSSRNNKNKNCHKREMKTIHKKSRVSRTYSKNKETKPTGLQSRCHKVHPISSNNRR